MPFERSVPIILKGFVLMPKFLYAQLEQQLREEIRSGQRPPGSKLPSVREMCVLTDLSKSTVLNAYGRLEAEGVIQARSRSGYFVSPQTQPLDIPPQSDPVLAPTPLGQEQILLDIMAQGAAFDIRPGLDEEPTNLKLQRSLSRAPRAQSSAQYLYYDEPKGLLALRKQVAAMMARGGAHVTEDELLITSGCQHGLLLALMATTKPGDVVALESPGYYGTFQLIEALGLQALELPCLADTGLSPDALRLALQHWSITALVVSPCFATPTGANMPSENKQKLLALAEEYDIALIEDDIYGELYFGAQRPRSLYSYDSQGRVLQCSSFSKSLSRDLRLGWIAPGKYTQEVLRLKLATTMAVPQVLQQGLSQYIAEGGFDRHLRRKRGQFRERCRELMELIQRYLPMAKRCSQPEGGLALWLELPESVDTIALYNAGRLEGIVLTPGRLFTAQTRYQNFLRISYAHPWTEGRRSALCRLGELIVEQQ